MARRQSRGVALVAVLLLVAGLIAIATAVVTVSVSQQRAAQRAHEADVRRETLDGALRVAMAEIAYGKPSGPFWHPRVPRVVIVGGKRVEVSLERESGRIDLNTADERFLVAGLIAAGKSEAQARIGAVRIRDWIDADDKPAPNGGAERVEYGRAKLPYEPRNAPMESIDEVRQVLDLHDLSESDLDAFTVYSQQHEPMFSEAPSAARAAFDWLAAAAGNGGVNAAVLPAQLPNAGDPASYAGSVIRLRACEENRETACRLIIVRVTGSARQPWLVLSWR